MSEALKRQIVFGRKKWTRRQWPEFWDVSNQLRLIDEGKADHLFADAVQKAHVRADIELELTRLVHEVLRGSPGTVEELPGGRWKLADRA